MHRLALKLTAVFVMSLAGTIRRHTGSRGRRCRTTERYFLHRGRRQLERLRLLRKLSSQNASHRRSREERNPIRPGVPHRQQLQPEPVKHHHRPLPAQQREGCRTAPADLRESAVVSRVASRRRLLHSDQRQASHDFHKEPRRRNSTKAVRPCRRRTSQRKQRRPRELVEDDAGPTQRHSVFLLVCRVRRSPWLGCRQTVGRKAVRTDAQSRRCHRATVSGLTIRKPATISRRTTTRSRVSTITSEPSSPN